MRSRLWNTFEKTMPWLNHSSRQRLSNTQSISRFSTSSSSRALFNPERDATLARRQKESDILRPSQPTANEKSTSGSQGLKGILNVLNSRDHVNGQKASTYIDGLRVRQEQLYSAYGNRSPPHNLHIYAHKHNTILTLTKPNGNPILSVGCGSLGFRKSHRSGYDPAFQLSSHVFAQIQEKGLLHEISKIGLVFRGFGLGREAFIKVLLGNEGRNIRPLVSRVTDATRIKFGGTRSRQVRRLG